MNIQKEYSKRLFLLKRNRWLRFVSSLFVPVALALGLGSCTERTLEAQPTEGYAVIHASWNDGVIPPTSGFRFYFYPENGSRVLEYDAAATGFEGSLPAGTYRVIACSTDARNAVYQGMESYSSAAVRALPDVSSRAVSYYAQPSGVYILHLGKLFIPVNDRIETQVVPDTLSRSVNLKFSLLGTESILSLNGLTRGVLSTVLLSSKIGLAETGVTSFDSKVSGKEAVAQISVLGILDPQGSLPYRNLMDLTVTLSDKSVRTVQVDMTTFISEVLTSHSGSLPMDISAEVELRLINTQLVASVKPWQQSSGEGSVK